MNQSSHPASGMVKKAVIPAAGLGSRMLPITKNIPKEMLPVGRKPMIQYSVEEAIASGLKEICIVIRTGKEIIRDYFCLRYPHDHKRDRDIEKLEQLIAGCELTFIYQEHPLGLGDALLQARNFVGNNPFVMLIPDQLFHATSLATQQLLQQWRPGLAIWTSLIKIPKAELLYFAGARGFAYNLGVGSNELILKRVCTETEAHQMFADFDYEIRGFGRTVYPAAIFDYLGQEFTNPHTGEVDLLKTFEECTKTIPHYGLLLEGEPFDVGTFQGYYHYLSRL